jgi:transposase
MLRVVMLCLEHEITDRLPTLPAPTPPACTEPRELRIELRRGAIVATVNWPMSATPECAAWLREVLR